MHCKNENEQTSYALFLLDFLLESRKEKKKEIEVL